MASLRELSKAIRLKYGPSDSSVKLSELLFFLDSLQDPPDLAFQGQKQQRPKGQGLEASQHAPRPQVQAQAKPQAKPQAQKAPTVDYRHTRATTAPPTALQTQEQRPWTFAEVAKAAKQRLQPQPQKPRLPTRLIEQKPAIARPFSVYYSDPKALEASPEALLGNITSQQQKQAIRGVKRVSQRLLLVYPRTIEARTYLEDTQSEWLQQIGGTLARKLFYVAVGNIDPLEVLETLKT